MIQYEECHAFPIGGIRSRGACWATAKARWVWRRGEGNQLERYGMELPQPRSGASPYFELARAPMNGGCVRVVGRGPHLIERQQHCGRCGHAAERPSIEVVF